MSDYEIPLIIRGEVITDDMVRFEARRGEIAFRTPDAKKYVDRLVLRNPGDMEDLYGLTVADILDYLDALGRRLSPDDNPHIRTALEMNIRSSGHSPQMLRANYAFMGRALARDLVAEAVEQNMGFACLDGWERRQLHDRTVRIRAFGARTVHLNAGNGPVVALFGLINGSVLRCDNIVKAPSNDPFTATALALTMIDMAPDHPITRHWSVAYWKGGDAEFERRFYRPTNIEKIVAWGGFASMGHVRGYLGPGMDLVALDPKLSGSMIGREAFASPETMRAVAERLARDVGYYNQEGCVNARTAYVESGTDEAGIGNLNRLGRLVFDAIQNLPGDFSSVHPAFDPVLRQEIDGIRYSGVFRVVGGRGDEGAVIVSQESEAVDFSDRLGCRVVNLIPVDRIEDALRHVTIDTQTLGIYPESLKDRIGRQCALRGAQRLTTLGCAPFEGIFAAPHDAIELMRRMVRWVVIEDFDEGRVEHGAGIVRGDWESPGAALGS